MFFFLSLLIYIVPGMGQGEILRTIKPAHPTEALRCPPLPRKPGAEAQPAPAVAHIQNLSMIFCIILMGISRI